MVATGTRVLSAGPYDIRRTVLVCGFQRSGTTWVADAISTLPGAALLFEPLHLDRVPAARSAGFWWRNYKDPASPWPEGERFLDRVFRGHVLNHWTAQEISRPVRVETWIVKCIRMNRLLPWLTPRYPIRPPLLLLRHPCAVVASMLRNSWYVPDDVADDGVLAAHPRLEPVLDAIEAPEERLAAWWAIDTLVPLSAPRPHPWLTIPYEKILESPEALDPAFQAWQLDPPSTLNSALGRWSSTASKTRKGAPSSRTAVDWMEQLDAATISRILAVTRSMGIDFYGEDPDPDDDKLAAWLSEAR